MKGKKREKTNLRMVREVPGLNPGGNPLFDPSLSEEKEGCPAFKKRGWYFAMNDVTLWTHTASILGSGNKKKKKIVHLKLFRDPYFATWKNQSYMGLESSDPLPQRSKWKIPKRIFFDKAVKKDNCLPLSNQPKI